MKSEDTQSAFICQGRRDSSLRTVLWCFLPGFTEDPLHFTADTLPALPRKEDAAAADNRQHGDLDDSVRHSTPPPTLWGTTLTITFLE